jgi:hypothetical protein
LRATIDWSFSLLGPSEQVLLEGASVFRGGFDLVAAAAVGGEAVDVLADVESLVEKSLVRQAAAGGTPRFTMLETIREFAGDRLAAGDRADEARRRHADYFLNLVVDVGGELRSDAQATSLDRLELESDNVRAALRWSLERGDPERVAEAGWPLMPFWWLRGLFDEGTRWMSEAVESGRLSAEGRAQALLVLGFIAFWRADYATAIPALSEAFGVFTSVGDRHRAALARLPLAAAQAGGGDATAIDALEESRAVFTEAGDEWGLMSSLNALGYALNMLRLDAPLELFEEARERARAVGTDAELATAVGNLSRRRAIRGETEAARLLSAEVLGIVRGLRSPTGIAYYTEMAADLAAAEEDHETAVRLFSAAAEIRAASDAEVPPPVAAMRERALAAARAALGDEAVEAARRAGARLETYETADAAIAWSSGEPSP